MGSKHGRTVDRLAAIASRGDSLVVGLSSGTSFDGIDAALVRISDTDNATTAAIEEFICVPFDDGLRSRLARSSEHTASELSRLNFDLGRAFGAAALSLLDRAGVPASDIDLIGSHGQTVFHSPPDEYGEGGHTMQIGEADVIASMTGVVTVADFRTADVAAGGSGAPLIPYVDWLLFRREGELRVMLNIGGIANVTWVPNDLEDVVAFDTGPGNGLSDEIVRLHSGGALHYDEGGTGAMRGSASGEAVEAFLNDPYFRRLPPKSTGKERFGRDAALALCELAFPGRSIADLVRREVDDLLATAAVVTSRSIADSLTLLPHSRSRCEIFVSGGGVHNEAIVSGLERLVSPIVVRPLGELGVDPDAKEALGFAVLASETVRGRAGNVTGATGAGRRVVLGKISIGL